MNNLGNDILKYVLAVVLSIICAFVLIQNTLSPGTETLNLQAILSHSKELCVSAITIFVSFIIIGILLTHSSITAAKLREERRITRVLKKKDEIKTKFLAFAAHNLRTPATALRWSLNDFLKNEMERLTKDQQDSVRSLYSVSLTMLNIIEDFLDISKLELQKFEIGLKATPLTTLKEKVLSAVDAFMPIAKEKNITMTSSFNISEHAHIHVDMSQLARVIENIIENALNYTLEHGTVEVALSNNQDNMIFSVKDTGIGIPHKEHPMIFGEFFRSSNAKKHKSTGSGIGLYLARKIVEAHNGKIQFTSEEGTGSTFTFTIPMITENEKEVTDVFKRI